MEYLKQLLEQLKKEQVDLTSALEAVTKHTADIIAEAQRIIDEGGRPISPEPRQKGTLLDVPHVHQIGNKWRNDCGCACIAMILSFKGHQTTLDEACDLCGKQDHNYVTLWRLVAGMKKKDVRARTVKDGLNGARIKQEIDGGRPVIVLLEYDDLPKRHRSPLGGTNQDFWHFVVVTGYDDEAGVFVVNDPLSYQPSLEWSQAGLLEAMNGDMNGSPRQGVVLVD